GFVPFEPAKNPPVLKVIDKNCVPGVGDCFLSQSPAPELSIATSATLTPPDLGSVTPASVPAGQSIALVNAAAIVNTGQLAASDRPHGYFPLPARCPFPPWNTSPNGDDLPSCAVLLAEQTFVSPNNLAPGAQEALLATIPIPSTTTPGSYRLL